MSWAREKKINTVGIDAVLGTGGFGEVRRGQLKKPGAPLVTVAIKQAHQESYNRMFLEEASVMAKLNHEVILKLLAVTHDRGKVELVLEYMENGDLVDAIIMVRKVTWAWNWSLYRVIFLENKK